MSTEQITEQTKKKQLNRFFFVKKRKRKFRFTLQAFINYGISKNKKLCVRLILHTNLDIFTHMCVCVCVWALLSPFWSAFRLFSLLGIFTNYDSVSAIFRFETIVNTRKHKQTHLIYT